MGGIPRLPLPRVPFSDCAAEVEAVGPRRHPREARRPRVGQLLPGWQGGRPNPSVMGVVFGDQVDGFVQSSATVPADSLVIAPRTSPSRRSRPSAAPA
jgi:NADPH:quinone reductase-like Zn-dependent oxidoreductase